MPYALSAPLPMHGFQLHYRVHRGVLDLRSPPHFSSFAPPPGSANFSSFAPPTECCAENSRYTTISRDIPGYLMREMGHSVRSVDSQNAPSQDLTKAALQHSILDSIPVTQTSCTLHVPTVQGGFTSGPNAIVHFCSVGRL